MGLAVALGQISPVVPVSLFRECSMFIYLRSDSEQPRFTTPPHFGFHTDIEYIDQKKAIIIIIIIIIIG